MTVVSNLPISDEAELDRSIILNIFSSIGRCRFLEEKNFDACTALSGSGPAFACIFLEAMADGGVMMGLPRAEALELAAQSEILLVAQHIPLICFTSFTRRGTHGSPSRSSPSSNKRLSHKLVAPHPKLPIVLMDALLAKQLPADVQ